MHKELNYDIMATETDAAYDMQAKRLLGHMVGLPKKLPERKEKDELHRLLYALLNSDLPVADRIQIVEEECPSQVDDELREELSEMCNLSQGVKEEARIQGRAEGREEGRSTALLTTVRNLMDSMSLNAGEAMDALKIPEEERENIRKQLSAENVHV